MMSSSKRFKAAKRGEKRHAETKLSSAKASKKKRTEEAPVVPLRKGPTLLMRPSITIENLDKHLPHLAVGLFRERRYYTIANLQLVYDNTHPLTTHNIAIELSPSPVVFLPNKDDNSSNLTVRLTGKNGANFEKIYSGLIETTANILAKDKVNWEALDVQSPPSFEELMKTVKPAIVVDRYQPEDRLLRFRIPSSGLVCKDARKIDEKETVDEDELPTCDPSSIEPRDTVSGTFLVLDTKNSSTNSESQHFSGSLLVSGVWIQNNPIDNEAHHWGILLTARELTVTGPKTSLFCEEKMLPIEDFEAEVEK
jgi:hypothetical protein